MWSEFHISLVDDFTLSLLEDIPDMVDYYKAQSGDNRATINNPGGRIYDTGFSPPPSARSTDPIVPAAASCSSDEDVKRLMHDPSLYLGRHDVLWHVQQTLKDKVFWDLEIVEKTRQGTRTKLGFRADDIKRMIEWTISPTHVVTITDRTKSGAESCYTAQITDARASLEIRDPGKTLVFKKSVPPEACSDNTLDEANDWALTSEPIGQELIESVRATIFGFPESQNPSSSMQQWFESPSAKAERFL